MAVWIDQPSGTARMQVRMTLFLRLCAVAGGRRAEGRMQRLDQPFQTRHVCLAGRRAHGGWRLGPQQRDPQVPDLESALAGRLGAQRKPSHIGSVVVGLADLEDPRVEAALAHVLR